jgi:hypothetical protein
MATTKTTNTKAFINLGLVDCNTGKGVIAKKQKYIAIPERFAKYMSATYSTKQPEGTTVQVKKGKLSGRQVKREFAAKLSGRKYEFGYSTPGAGSFGSKRSSIRWIPVHVPRDITLFVFLKAFIPKLGKKPAFIKTPEGVSTRFISVN